ncbi:MAG: bifunctional precorrin-2 dehydrogenase/sirohydrochlorin ferrochelatase [Peptococcaceae bacterium]|nr:bifunctional precorrin-2 dehydrogenase/sirohydrochlorin ferrochelatase [Peptococcaceae bacterium]
MGFTYGVSLNLQDKKCIVVGGGAVAERKILRLLENKAVVTVVSPQLTENLQKLQKQFIWIADTYQESYLEDSFLVIAATNSREVNQEIAQYCHAHNKLVNIIDSLEESNFTVNSTVQRGDLLLTISTGGASPALAKKIRQQLEEQYGPEYAVVLDIMRTLRAEAMEKISDEEKRRTFLQELGQTDIEKILQTETTEEWEKRVRLCLSSY